MKLINNADSFKFPIYKPYNKLSKEEIEILWNGNEHFTGINKFFKYLEKKNYKIQNRVLYQDIVVKPYVMNVKEVGLEKNPIM